VKVNGTALICPDNYLALKIKLGDQELIIANDNILYKHDLGAVPYAIIKGDFVSWQETYKEGKNMRYSASSC